MVQPSARVGRKRMTGGSVADFHFRRTVGVDGDKLDAAADVERLDGGARGTATQIVAPTVA